MAVASQASSSAREDRDAHVPLDKVAANRAGDVAAFAGPGGPAPRPELRSVADAPLSRDDEDLLGFKVLADALHGIVTNPETATPLTVAINAPWGAGKSSLANLVANRLKEQSVLDPGRRNHVVWFNAWQHQDAPSLGGALVAKVVRAAARARPWWRKIVPLSRSLLTPGEAQRQRAWTWAALAVVLAAGLVLALRRWPVQSMGFLDHALAALVPDTLEKVGPLTGAFSVTAVLALIKIARAVAGAVAPAAASVAKLVQDPAGSACTASGREVAEELGKLMRQATRGGGRLVVFVDDLERCAPPKPVELLEAVNLHLSHENVVVVLLADMKAIAAAAELRYRDLAALYVPGNGVTAGRPADTLAFGHAFIRKVIQLQVDLPVANDAAQVLHALATKRRAPEEVMGAGGAGIIGKVQKGVAWIRGVTKAAGGRLSVITEHEERFHPALGAVLWVCFFPEVLLTVISRRVLSEEIREAVPKSKFHDMTWAAGHITLVMAVIARVFLFVDPLASNFFKNKDGVHTLAWLNIVTVCCEVPAFTAWIICARFLGSQTLKKARALVVKKSANVRFPGHGVNLSALRTEAHQQFGLGLESKLITRLVEEIFRRNTINDSGLLKVAYGEVTTFLPPPPRALKQVLNRLRFFIYIAEAWGLLADENRPRTLRQIGKWVVLNERWPDLAGTCVLSPQTAVELQTAARDETKFAEAVGKVCPQYAKDAELQKLFAAGEAFDQTLVELLRLKTSAAVKVVMA